MGRLGLTRRETALAVVVLGAALLVVAAALQWGAAIAFAVAGVWAVLIGLFLVDVADSKTEAGRGVTLGRRP